MFIIPAYNPSPQLINLVGEIRLKSSLIIIVINDGSNEKNASNIFASVAKIKNVILLQHYFNLGKGAALKTAFNYVLNNYPNTQSCATLDCDGQHSVNDCLKVLSEVSRHHFLVLGYRTFEKNIPWKSYLGNNLSKLIYAILIGKRFKDTQTGLRGLSKCFMIESLKIKSSRFEFETEQLIIAADWCKYKKSDIRQREIKEIPIETLYFEGNKNTTFRPFLDSIKIYYTLFRYALSSIAVLAVDLLVFLTFYSIGVNLLNSNIFARAVAIVVQFMLVRSFVFKSQAGWGSFIFFSVYALFMGYVSSKLQVEFSHLSGSPFVLLNKLIIDGVLFLINFAFLRNFIFNRGKYDP